MNELDKLTENTVIHTTRLLQTLKKLRAKREELKTAAPGTDEAKQIYADIQRLESIAYTEDILSKEYEQTEQICITDLLNRQNDK